MDEKIAILLKAAEELRKNGVVRLVVDGLEVQFSPLLPQAESPTLQQEEMGRSPEMFGLPPGTPMPSLRNRMTRNG